MRTPPLTDPIVDRLRRRLPTPPQGNVGRKLSAELLAATSPSKENFSSANTLKTTCNEDICDSAAVTLRTNTTHSDMYSSPLVRSSIRPDSDCYRRTPLLVNPSPVAAANVVVVADRHQPPPPPLGTPPLTSIGGVRWSSQQRCEPPRRDIHRRKVKVLDHIEEVRGV